jgi:exodeoxyribonuclease VII small subunit
MTAPSSKRKSLESKEDSNEPVSFEDAITRLSGIVEQLERGDLPLGESVKLFEEGVSLVRTSQQELDTAERRIEELLAVDEDGQAKTVAFE